MGIAEDTQDTAKPRKHGRVFRPLNPAFFVALVTFVIASLVSRGLTIAAFLPVMSNGQVPILAAYPIGSKVLLLVLPGLLFLSWLVSGYAADRRWLQVTASVSAFAVMVVISAVLALTTFAAGMDH